ncbi:MAG: hypothetical protein Q4B17_11745 [Lautropia sp.]|nr:hypothetical protein [Lautropia sp.]
MKASDAFSTGLTMTAQIRDRVRFRGEDYSLAAATRPLEPLFRRHGRPLFVIQHTGMALGYHANWEVVDDRLYLTEMCGQYFVVPHCDEDFWRDGFRQLFSDGDKAFAEWFSGELCLPQGEAEFDAEGYWIHMYPSCIYLSIERGVVIGERVVKNPPAPWEKAAE